MTSSIFNTDFKAPSNGTSDASYWESIFPCDEDFKPVLKKRRLNQDDVSNGGYVMSMGRTEPQYCELQYQFAPVLDSQENLFGAFIEEMRNNIKRKREQQNHTPPGEDLLQYCLSQVPGLSEELGLVSFTAPVASSSPTHGVVSEVPGLSEELVNFTAPVVSPSPTHSVVPEVPGLSEELVNFTAPVVSPSPRRGGGGGGGVRTQSTMVVQGNEIRHSCNICLKTFVTNRGLKIHLYTHRPPISNMIPSPKPYSCPICTHAFSGRQGLLVHLVTQVCRLSERLLRRVTVGWECTSCYKVFSSRKSAEIHIRIHRSSRGLACPVCREDFTGMTGNVLVRHVKNKHPAYFEYFGC